MRSRRVEVPVAKFDVAANRWVPAGRFAGPGVATDRDELVLTTFNIWFSDYHAPARWRAIAQLLARNPPDVMVFQEVTPEALAIFLEQPWIRVRYRCAAVTGRTVGNYGLLLLSRIPLDRVTYTRLPTQLQRGFLTAELTIDGRPVVVAGIHLESGKAAARLRARQLGRVYGALRRTETAVVLGDFNMRDSENAIISRPFRDVWPVLRPADDGFTEDTSINLMRYDSKNKHRHVRFDRVLLKGDRWAPTDIELLGTQPLSADLPRVFPSDHFGVRCRLERRDGPSADTARHQRFWRR